MRIKKISKPKSKIKSKNKSKNESKAMEGKDFELKESSVELSSDKISLESSKIKNKPKIKSKMIKSKDEPTTMDFLKSELNNIIRKEDENGKKKQKAKKDPKAFKKNKEKEFIKVMASIANSIKEIEIDITKAVNLIKEIFNERDEKDDEVKSRGKDKAEGGDKGGKKAEGAKKVKGKAEGDKKVKVNKDKVKDITIQDSNSLINPSIIQHSDPSYISFSGESYSIDKIIRKLKDKYKNNQFSSSMARSGMFTSSKRPKKDEWDTFLENLVEKNVLKKTSGRPVKYKF